MAPNDAVRRRATERDRRLSTASRWKPPHHKHRRLLSHNETREPPVERQGDETPRVEVKIIDIDYHRETFIFSIKIGIAISKLEEVLRKRSKFAIPEDSHVLFFLDGEQLDPDGLFDRRARSPTIYYRVLTTPGDGLLKVTQFRDCEEAYTLNQEFLDGLASDIEEGHTAKQLRDKVAAQLDIEDSNRIVLIARGGLRPGSIEGTAWEIRQLKSWICREITVDVCFPGEYMVLKGHGGEYIYQPDHPDGRYTEVQRLKIFVRALVRGVHQTCGSKITICPEDVNILCDGRVKGARFPISWGRTVNFQLPDHIAEAFESDQTWALPATEVCTVCGDDKRCTEIPQRITALCLHKPTLCKDCLRQWLQSSLETSTWDRLKCPECPEFLKFDNVRRFASREVFARYDELATRAALKDVPSFRWCLSPKCRSGQISVDDCPRFKCKACGYRQCVRHNVPWHSGETCEDYDRRNKQRRRDEKASERIIKETSKNCPECKKAVHKYVGCNHITCVCRHEWCYICLAAYQRNEHGFLFCRHNPGCTERDPFLEFIEGPNAIPGLRIPPPGMRRPPPRPNPGGVPGVPPPPPPPPPPGAGEGPFGFDFRAHFGVPPNAAGINGNNHHGRPAPFGFPFDPMFNRPFRQIDDPNQRMDAVFAAAVETMTRGGARANDPRTDLELMTDALFTGFFAHVHPPPFRP